MARGHGKHINAGKQKPKSYPGKSRVSAKGASAGKGGFMRAVGVGGKGQKHERQMKGRG